MNPMLAAVQAPRLAAAHWMTARAISATAASSSSCDGAVTEMSPVTSTSA